MPNLVEKVRNLLFGEQKYCRLDAVAKLEMRDVAIISEGWSLRHGTDPLYLYVKYQNEWAATVYPDHLERRSIHFPREEDQQQVEKVWRILETYYS